MLKNHPNYKTREGPVKVEYETNGKQRAKKLWTRKKGLLGKVYELHTICGGTIVLKYVHENGKGWCYSSSDEKWEDYKVNGLKPGKDERRLNQKNEMVDVITDEYKDTTGDGTVAKAKDTAISITFGAPNENTEHVAQPWIKIGEQYERWKQLKSSMRNPSDEKLATLLIDMYEQTSSHNEEISTKGSQLSFEDDQDNSYLMSYDISNVKKETEELLPYRDYDFGAETSDDEDTDANAQLSPVENKDKESGRSKTVGNSANLKLETGEIDDGVCNNESFVAKVLTDIGEEKGTTEMTEVGDAQKQSTVYSSTGFKEDQVGERIVSAESSVLHSMPEVTCKRCMKTVTARHYKNVHEKLCKAAAIRLKTTGTEYYKCPTCEKVYVKPLSLAKHKRTCNGKKTPSIRRCISYLCAICKRSFTSKCGRNSHIRLCKAAYARLRTTGTKHYKCNKCGDVFREAHRLAKHKQTCTGVLMGKEIKIKCQYCSKITLKKTYKYLHLPACKRAAERLEATGTKHFKCKTCNKELKSPKWLARHEETCTGQRKKKKKKIYHDVRIKCEICSKMTMKRHYKYQHLPACKRAAERLAATGTRYYRCKMCNEEFKQVKRLATHEETCNGQRQRKMYSCPFCDKVFADSFYLKDHINTHSGEKPYACKHCDARFSVRSHLRLHMIKMHADHFQAKKHVCQFCAAVYKTSSQLAHHEMDHTGERPYSCGQCQKQFKDTQQLARHQVIHSGLLPHTCQYCGKGFTSQYNMQCHERSMHTGEMTHFCPRCNKGFLRADYVQRHLKSCQMQM